MSSYATITDLQTIMPNALVEQLASDNTGGMSTDEVVSALITEMSAVIDSYLASKTALPLVTVPDAVTWCCKELVRWRLYGRTGFAINDDVQRGYDDAMRWLRDIASGKASVGEPAVTSAESGESYLRYNARAFTRDTMTGF